MQIKPPIPVKANFTFFEVTNPVEVSAGEIPNLRGEQVWKDSDPTNSFLLHREGPLCVYRVQGEEESSLEWK